MQIKLITYGTRGDVQPYLVLGRALAARGHDVVVAASEDACDFVTAGGLPFAPLAGSVREILESDEGRSMLARGHLIALTRRITSYMREIRDAFDDSVEAALAGADLAVVHMPVVPRVASACEKRGIGMVAAHVIPAAPTRDFECPMLGFPVQPRVLRKASHHLIDLVMHLAGKTDVNHFRHKLGLRSIRRSAWTSLHESGTPVLSFCSPAMLPPPPDWEPRWIMAGVPVPDHALRLRIGETPAPDLLDFIESGDPPFFISFGSMPVVDPEAMVRETLAALERVGGRAIVGAGWTRAIETPDSKRVFMVGGVDHESVLPRCAGVVHHGGSGTTAAVARAGVPSAVFSVFADQPFWGTTLERLGVGVHRRFRELSAPVLAKSLLELRDSDRCDRARDLGQRMRADDATARITRSIEQWATTAPAPAL